MNTRSWTLVGIFAALGLLYAVFFTDWLRPEPIQIASQVRASILPPRFGRPTTKLIMSNLPPAKGEILMRTNLVLVTSQARRVPLPDWGTIDPAPGGVANVTFSLDGRFVLTALRVEDVPADGTPPKIFWHLRGKSQPMRALLYGRDPKGMSPVQPGATGATLTAGVPYRLIIEAGRRRGTNYFTTTTPAMER